VTAPELSPRERSIVAMFGIHPEMHALSEDDIIAGRRAAWDEAKQTPDNNPTLAAHARASEFGHELSSTAAAHIAEAVIAASGLRTERDAALAVIEKAPHTSACELVPFEPGGHDCTCWKSKVDTSPLRTREAEQVWTCGHCGRASTAHAPGMPAADCVYEPVLRALAEGGDRNG
jgi:hypothetical protein